ncbi:hypothetical protein VPH35_021556 [Triticum aestivum]
MDLLEVFLRRRIQSLQARDHPMWLYSGLDDTTRIHPEEVTDEMLEGWLSSITGNKDNPRGARRVIPVDNSYDMDQATTEMYSTPNGAQGPTEEGEASGGESGDDQGEWESDGEGEGGDDVDSSEEEEEEFEPPPPPPPRQKGRSKLTHDPARECGSATAPVGQSSKRPRTSSPTPTGKAPKNPRTAPSKPPKALPKMKMAVPTISGAATSAISAKDDDQEMEDAVTSNPARYTELEKQKIQPNLDLELARTELQKVRDGAAEKLSEALAKKDQDLAAARKEADDKTALAEQKLASVSQLEEENAKLKTALNEANRECTRWKKENLTLSEKVEGIARRRDGLESYLRSLAKKLYIKLEELCQNFEEETGRIKTGLDPINSPVKDEAAMNLLRLESHIDGVVDYLARLKVAMSRIDPALWPEATLQNGLESLMTRLNGIPDQVQEWKKSSARCGADVALSLVRVHCKEAREEKLAAIQVANTRKHNFQDFMETFIAAATRIADGIDLDEFIAPSSPPPEE